MKILLMGNPNVGKSVLFSRLTGVHVIASNYPGTTVEFNQGTTHIDHEDVAVIDVPGTYSLKPSSQAEEVALKVFKETFPIDGQNIDAVVINVIESTNLERSLNLTLQLLKRKIPMVAALNFWDETKHKGIGIDLEKLQRKLKIPCVPTCAPAGVGIKQLVDQVKKAPRTEFDFDEKERWRLVGEIVEEVETVTHKRHTVLEKLGDFSISPVGGIFVAAGVLLASFEVIRMIGEGLITHVFEPIFQRIWAPLMLHVSNLLGGEGFIHNILIGKLKEGKIDFGESFGLLTTGLHVPFSAVLPYVLAFYLVLSLLEDCGYLPRLAVMVDNLMHRLGVHGYAVIPMTLALGCNVPGTLSTRIMETRRERFITATIVAIAIPCMAQTAMIVGLVGKHGAKGLGIVFGTLFAVAIILGLGLNKTMKGQSAELFVEIPPYRLPYLRAVLKKVWMRLWWCAKEAVPWVLLGVLLVNILHLLGVIQFIGGVLQPIVSGILGLPPDAVGALLMGFLRKDLAVGMLVPLHLPLKQLIIASVVLAMYFPCAATFAVMFKEFGPKDMLRATLIMIFSTLIVGGFLNLVLS